MPPVAELDLMIAPYGKDREGNAHHPNPSQQKVLDWIDRIRTTPQSDKDHIPVLYLQGGVGCGKSRGVLAPIIEMLLEIPGLRVLWGRNDFKDLKLSIMDKFFEVLPAELIIAKSEQYHWYDITQGENPPGRIYFNGLKDIGGLGSQEFGIIAVTEALEMTEQIYRALKRRCRQENVVNAILMESEPPNEDHWLAKVTDPKCEEYDSDIEKWEISTYENWENLPVAYRGSLETMPEAWKKKYLYGHFGFKPDGKPYYQGFKEQLHTGEFEWNPERELICGWDWGYHHPCCLITQIDLQDRWIWLRQIYGSDITIDKFAEVVKEQLNLYYPNANVRHYGGPDVVNVSDKSEQTSWEILNAKGIKVGYRKSEYRERKEIIEQKLALLIGIKPALLVDRRYCKIAVDGFLGGYHYPIYKDGLPFSDKHELPFKDGYYEHVMNAGEYIAVNLFSPIKRADYGRSAKQKSRIHEQKNLTNAGFGYRR